MRIALVNAPLVSIVCDRGIGHQLPLGLLAVGGPLLAAGHTVTLIDAAARHLDDAAIVAAVAAFRADLVMIGHTGSTTAHPCAVHVLRALKAALPGLYTVYGGVHPTYHFRAILAQEPTIDAIVRGEGEATAVELVAARAAAREPEHVPGVVWRRGDALVVNPPRAPIADLDALPVAYGLVEDWDRYRAFGWGRAAGVQFSRGCPHHCTYCGQWLFWQRWRHRTPARVVAEIEALHRRHDIRFFWLADENPTTDPALWREFLERLAALRLPIALCASIRAADIVRDREFAHLYRAAGFLYVLMGVETASDAVSERVRKDSSCDDAHAAIRILRQVGVLSIVDYVFGLEEESLRSMARGFRGLLRYDGDFVNALYLTPHAWTPLGQQLRGQAVVTADPWRWDYRHQVLATRSLSPRTLFLGVKLIELLYHLRPRMLCRMLWGRDRRLRRQLRWGFRQAARVFLGELRERVALRIQPGSPAANGRSVSGP